MAADRPFAYVASPYRGETAADVTANVARARARAYSLAVYDAGYTPLAPHLLFPQFLHDNDPAQRSAGIAMANSLLRLCRVVVLCGDRISDGMAAEAALAREIGIQITSLDELVALTELRAFAEIGGMTLKHISTDELKQMTGSEGLILQGCGGDPKEWVDGINDMLTKAGILQNGAKFTDISVFEHDGLTNIMFGMNNLNADELDIGKLAIWRLKTHEQFGGTLLSDYLPNKLGVNRNAPEIDGDGVERLSAIDAGKIGQWSVDREFAVNKSEFAGVEKWAARASAEILRQTERGERSKTKTNGEEL